MQNNSLKGSLLNLETQRKFAKIGLGVSLAAVTLSAFCMKNRSIKAVHIVAGAALVGFSIYHHGLYNGGFAEKAIKNARKKQNMTTINENDEKISENSAKTLTTQAVKAKRSRKLKATLA